ncbi:MAG TPA: 6-hydroxycyclohex-1-ene-1-carbonyl-CoA dehydrogenase [Candidatus Angelobacter sp.]|nr:6-hydroxycyclohex-1-ene-1-carbonyl-CoA dehydrogenase [Candidatus Angelobacter sp.]
MTVHGAYGYQLTQVGKPLGLVELPALEPGGGDVIVKVAGCGVCHTDIGFAFDGVPTRHELPLVLGHEITGKVVAAGEEAQQWQGQTVIVPAVIACGKCAACKAGRPTICRKQFMPGNDGDGGFASHVRVPTRGLCRVPANLPVGISLEALSVVADAVTTPYEAIRRSGLKAGEAAVIVGAGGIGGFGVQIAAALGAKVVAIDIDAERLELVQLHGAALVLNSDRSDEKQLRSTVRNFAAEFGAPGSTLKIFEMSGTAEGQRTAYSLLDFGAYLGVVGYTPKKIEVRLSNLMAFDATAQGNWGCPAEQYPAALQLVLEGRIAIEPFIERHRLEEVPEIMEGIARHAFSRRVVVMPNGRNDAEGELG